MQLDDDLSKGLIVVIGTKPKDPTSHRLFFCTLVMPDLKYFPSLNDLDWRIGGRMNKVFQEVIDSAIEKKQGIAKLDTTRCEGSWAAMLNPAELLPSAILDVVAKACSDHAIAPDRVRWVVGYEGIAVRDEYFQTRPKFKKPEDFNGGYLWYQSRSYDDGIHWRPALIIGTTSQYIYVKELLSRERLQGERHHTRGSTRVNRAELLANGQWKYTRTFGKRKVLYGTYHLENGKGDNDVLVWERGGFYWTNNHEDYKYYFQKRAREENITLKHATIKIGIEGGARMILELRRKLQMAHPDLGGDAQTFQELKEELDDLRAYIKQMTEQEHEHWKQGKTCNL